MDAARDDIRGSDEASTIASLCDDLVATALRVGQDTCFQAAIARAMVLQRRKLC
jgi:hypothetical protein